MSDFLRLSRIAKTFDVNGQRFEVLHDVDMNVSEGEFVCVLGPSGCGKTVLLHLVAGFATPTHGAVTISGDAIAGPSRGRVMVFQDYVLFPWKNVAGNVGFGLKALGHLDRAEKVRRVSEMLKLMSLEEFADWPVHKLSGGMQQKVAIARALIVEPKILLMDEPFSALDPTSRHLLRKWLSDVWITTRKTVLFVTHSVREAIFLADRIYLLTSRPATVKREYVVNLPRPRSIHAKELYALHEEIEKAMELESLRESPLAMAPEIRQLLRGEKP